MASGVDDRAKDGAGKAAEAEIDADVDCVDDWWWWFFFECYDHDRC